MKRRAEAGAMDLKTRKTYGPPKVPLTPSRAINSMLQTRCAKSYTNPVKAAVAYYICYVFQAITMLYEYIYTNKSRPSHTFWMASCGVVSVGIVIKAYLLYNMIVISAVVFHALLYYTAFLLAVVGIGLGISGIIFFDKDAGKAGATFRNTSSVPVSEMTSKAHGAGDDDWQYKTE